MILKKPLKKKAAFLTTAVFLFINWIPQCNPTTERKHPTLRVSVITRFVERTKNNQMENEQRIERNSCDITKLGILWRQTNLKAPQNRPRELSLFKAMRTKLSKLSKEERHYHITFTFTNIGRRSVARDLPPPNSPASCRPNPLFNFVAILKLILICSCKENYSDSSSSFTLVA